ncbi:MAG: PEP-CTERM sorting domain-containing protein [Tepidisphaeraceae bacterium]|jgi:hypothetical protein
MESVRKAGVVLNNSAVTVTTLAMLILGIVGVTQNVSAQQLSAGDLSAMTQSTASDTDAVFLWLLAGAPAVSPQNLSYNSTASATDWSGTLSGNYLGQALNLSYLGTTSEGTVSWSWNATGIFGSGNVAGNGTATISYPTSGTLDLIFSDALEYGGHTYALNYNIPGSILSDGTIMFGSLGDEEVGSGTIDLDGLLQADKPHKYSYLDADDTVASDDNGVALITGGANNKVYKYTDDGGLTGTIAAPVIPEPSTFVLVGIGVVSLLARRRRAA